MGELGIRGGKDIVHTRRLGCTGALGTARPGVGGGVRAEAGGRRRLRCGGDGWRHECLYVLLRWPQLRVIGICGRWAIVFQTAAAHQRRAPGPLLGGAPFGILVLVIVVVVVTVVVVCVCLVGLALGVLLDVQVQVDAKLLELGAQKVAPQLHEQDRGASSQSRALHRLLSSPRTPSPASTSDTVTQTRTIVLHVVRFELVGDVVKSTTRTPKYSFNRGTNTGRGKRKKQEVAAASLDELE
jgi:hypothetical protein